MPMKRLGVDAGNISGMKSGKMLGQFVDLSATGRKLRMTVDDGLGTRPDQQKQEKAPENRVTIRMSML